MAPDLGRRSQLFGRKDLATNPRLLPCGFGSRLRIGFPHIDGQPTLHIGVAVGLGTVALALDVLLLLYHERHERRFHTVGGHRRRARVGQDGGRHWQAGHSRRA